VIAGGLLGGLVVALLVAAQANGAAGDEVIGRARAAAGRVADREMRVTMRIIEGGSERRRTLLGYEAKTDAGRKVLWMFESPAELAGTSFLALPRPGGVDQLFVYFPAQRRVRQVPAEMRRERFQGSDFTYEDLTAVVYFDYDGTHRLERQEPCGSATCDVVATTLPEGRFAYTRLVSWVRGDSALPERVEFYAPQLAKVMRTARTAVVDGIPMVTGMEMDNPASGVHTRVEFDDVRVNGGVDPGRFSVEYLSHGK
jgi:hypothetical protein